MSASSKKKLRHEQEAAKMTERQLAEQKEAKKVKIYTIAFTVVLIALLVIAVTVGVTQTINNSGNRERNTVAMTAGSHEISNAELNYYYIDTVNNFYSQNASYAALFGMDLSKPLNEQVMDPETGDTWADYLLDSAKNTAVNVYAMNDAAAAAGFAAPADVEATVNSTVTTMSMYANIYGYADLETYLKTMYGKGASEEGYRNYIHMSLLADAYNNAYSESLVYEDADLRAAEADNFHKYSGFTYNYYYLPATRFLEGGTTAEDGTVTYSDEETAASVAAAKEAAQSLVSEDITSVEALDSAIASLPVNKDTTDVSTYYNDNPYGSIPAVIYEWLADDARKEGDLTVLENSYTDTEGKTTVNGYYVIYFHSVNDNTFALKNVRHILVNFEGGTADEYGNTTYSDEEKAAAKATAEEILAEFQAGNASEDAFASLATLKSGDTGSISTGGLYENIYPGQMVVAFENWCFDEARKTGDTGIVETEYGYHVMYFVGNSDVTYRDFQITNELRSTDLAAWQESIFTAMTVVDGDTKYIPMNMVLSSM
ncbi:MAG: peptidylprolyl isomerase [Oscillospiraceae bacterium]|nr:peptidylprolyl isomerase [Oscillospiraceae bacterium]